jgi:hypothetical protein
MLVPRTSHYVTNGTVEPHAVQRLSYRLCQWQAFIHLAPKLRHKLLLTECHPNVTSVSLERKSDLHLHLCLLILVHFRTAEQFALFLGIWPNWKV